MSISVVRTDAGRFPAVEAYCEMVLLKHLPAGAQYVKIDQAPDCGYPTNKETELFSNNSNFFVNLLCGLNQCVNQTCFLLDYDCLYPKGYFDHEVDLQAVNVTDDMIYLSKNGFFSRELPTTSVVCGSRDLLRELIWVQLRDWDNIKETATIAKTKNVQRVFYKLEHPAVDIRHGKNWSGSRYGEYFQEHPYWGNASQLFEQAIGI